MKKKMFFFFLFCVQKASTTDYVSKFVSFKHVFAFKTHTVNYHTEVAELSNRKENCVKSKK